MSARVITPERQLCAHRFVCCLTDKLSRFGPYLLNESQAVVDAVWAQRTLRRLEGEMAAPEQPN